MGKTLLDGGNTLILCFENFNCLLLAFFRVHQKLQLWLNILTTKWYIFVQNKVALIIKSSKDSKNGAKCNPRPLHHSFLSNPLKKLWHRYFNIGASKFFEIYLKFIFSVSPFMWIWNQSWKLISLCTGLCLRKRKLMRLRGFTDADKEERVQKCPQFLWTLFMDGTSLSKLVRVCYNWY